MMEDRPNADSMVAVDTDLVSAVEEALKRRGVFQKMKAQMRAEVFHALQDQTIVMPEKPADVFLASELIREFLTLLNMKNTLSVFCEEMGQPFEMSFDREFLGSELGVNTIGSDGKIPLLVYLVQMLKRNRAELLQGIEKDTEVVEATKDSV